MAQYGSTIYPSEKRTDPTRRFSDSQIVKDRDLILKYKDPNQFKNCAPKHLEPGKTLADYPLSEDTAELDNSHNYKYLFSYCAHKLAAGQQHSSIDQLRPNSADNCGKPHDLSYPVSSNSSDRIFQRLELIYPSYEQTKPLSLTKDKLPQRARKLSGPPALSTGTHRIWSPAEFDQTKTSTSPPQPLNFTKDYLLSTKKHSQHKSPNHQRRAPLCAIHPHLDTSMIHDLSTQHRTAEIASTCTPRTSSSMVSSEAATSRCNKAWKPPKVERSSLESNGNDSRNNNSMSSKKTKAPTEKSNEVRKTVQMRPRFPGDKPRFVTLPPGVNGLVRRSFESLAHKRAFLAKYKKTAGERERAIEQSSLPSDSDEEQAMDLTTKYRQVQDQTKPTSRHADPMPDLITNIKSAKKPSPGDATPDSFNSNAAVKFDSDSDDSDDKARRESKRKRKRDKEKKKKDKTSRRIEESDSIDDDQIDDKEIDKMRRKVARITQKIVSVVSQPKAAKSATAQRKPSVEEKELVHRDEEFARQLQHEEYMAARPSRRQMAEVANSRLIEQLQTIPKVIKSAEVSLAEPKKLSRRNSRLSCEESKDQEAKEPTKEQKPEVKISKEEEKPPEKRETSGSKRSKPKFRVQALMETIEYEAMDEELIHKRRRVRQMADSDSTDTCASSSSENALHSSSTSSKHRRHKKKKSLYAELESKYRKENYHFDKPYKMNADYIQFFGNGKDGKICINEICSAFYMYIEKKGLVYKSDDGIQYIKFDDKICDLFERSHTPSVFKMTEVGRTLIMIHIEYQKGNIIAPLSDKAALRASSSKSLLLKSELKLRKQD